MPFHLLRLAVFLEIRAIAAIVLSVEDEAAFEAGNGNTGRKHKKDDPETPSCLRKKGWDKFHEVIKYTEIQRFLS
jgi:hypothetical protein